MKYLMKGNARKLFTALVALLSMLINTQIYAEIHNSPVSCQPVNIGKQLVNGDEVKALEQSQSCVSFYKSSTETLPLDGALSGGKMLDVLLVGYYYCASAQIQATMGDFKTAQNSLRNAEEFALRWSNFYNSPLVDWPTVLDATKGFLLEKSGEIDFAKTWYEEHPSSYTLSRLSILLLSEGKYEDALQRAKQVLSWDTFNPTAHIVIASIYEKNGNAATALEEFSNAINYMDEAHTKNKFLPIIFIEAERAKSAIARLKKK